MGNPLSSCRTEFQSLVSRFLSPRACSCCYKLHCCCRCSQRYVIALLTATGFLIAFAIRCNISSTFLQIARNEQTQFVDTSKIHEMEQKVIDELKNYKTMVRNNSEQMPNEKPNHGHGLQWTPNEIGYIDSSFFWGYIISQVPGGIATGRYPAHRLFGLALLASSLLNLLIPGMAKLHFTMVLLVRFLQGLVEGVMYPACYGIWRYWAPPLERSRLATISFCGAYIGATVGLSLSSLLADRVWWQSPYYIFGATGIAWWILWHIFSFETPSAHPFIHNEERIYIENSLTVAASKKNCNHIPWKSIFTSLPVYAIIFANITQSAVFYLLMIRAPEYFGFVLRSDFAELGYPHFIMAIVVPISGVVADYFLKARILKVTNVRKLLTCVGFALEAVFLLAMGFASSTRQLSAFLVAAIVFGGFSISGFNVNHLDIAPRFASILIGLSGCAGSLSTMLFVFIVNVLKLEKTIIEWEVVYIIAAMAHFGVAIFYAIFASGEKQPWAELALDPETEAAQLASNPISSNQNNIKANAADNVPQTTDGAGIFIS